MLIFNLVFVIARSQSTDFMDSLKAIKGNQILIFESNCNGCFTIDPPCADYPNSGQPRDNYVIWKNHKGIHIKRFNICGYSETVTIRWWKNNPFKLISKSITELDTTIIKYPLKQNRKDSSWHEINLNHYKYYKLKFISFNIKDIEIKEYAFKTLDDDDYGDYDFEYIKNKPRYVYNNNSAIKSLMDTLLQKIFKLENIKHKLDITTLYKNPD